ncbi:GCN5-like N-acetyltransferase [Schizosaccharomyces japonicus yFS275]|uniref:GCN5-like N-acetyltransferase n=1 Tax=Schizosaccharomyces japonicus (strain yFS275 / FY16936) TaxID=402676 RepID=B6K731_SCHJY|nr:GCN5-like N-acetyltransferase [Schizosaccharomyces japonicus yFS275]EEB09335.1 GCN5-like N-acetyltransferase [Schizosaccharomyces japonicus yFS275]
MDNSNTCVDCGAIVLVPYQIRHVPTYNAWMKSPELQELTCSEPFSLEEEYKMQRSWCEDDDKFTFIVMHDPSKQLHPPVILKDKVLDIVEDTSKMIGDVNIFFQNEFVDEDDDDADPTKPPSDETITVGELELMIAKPLNRGHGFGTAMVGAFLHYLEQSGLANDKTIAKYRVKIGSSNVPSIRLFKHHGFKQVKYISFFDQVELERKRDTAPKVRS